jgi:2,3-bisphosphoglycerate-independent phosphoglycerate mutase
MKVVFVFIDGFGLGRDDPSVNPCASESLRVLRCVEAGETVRPAPENGTLIAADACLGVEGLPQSATGQTALFTGENAQAILGRHLPGYPNAALRGLLAERSLLKRLTDSGFSARFFNAYRPLFFRLPEPMKWRLSATTVATLAAGVPFFGLEDLRNRRCLYHDFTNEALIRRGIAAPRFTPEEAGEILARASAEHDFLLFEYFLTDKAGHGQDGAAALALLQGLDRLVLSLLRSLPTDEALLLIASDHGNIEDLSVRTHTRNRVPVFAWGRGKERIAERIRSIADVAPALFSLFGPAPAGSAAAKETP